MAVLDDRVGSALKRLRKELRFLRLANDRFDRRLAAAMEPAIILFGFRVPRPIRLARSVLSWFTRSWGASGKG